MRFRSTLIVALVAVGLGAYVYLHEIKGGEQRARRKADAARLLGIEPDQVTAIRITHSGTLFDLERKNGTWALIAPNPAPCDPRLVAAFLDTLATARREDEVGRGNLERYGLDDPAARLEIDVAGRTRSLSLGRINPLQTLVYVRVDDGQEVLLTTSSLLTYSLANAFGWRDKRMIDVDPASVQRMGFRTLIRGSLFVQRDSAGVWRVEGPAPWRCDPIRARSLAEGLARLECVGVQEENKSRIGGYGLDNRRFGATLELADGTTVGDLVIGHADGRGAYFGVVPDKPEIFKVDGRLVDSWVEFVGEPRDHKALPPFLPEKITRIEVRAPDDEFQLRRLSAIDWRVTRSQRVDSTFALAPSSVDGLLIELATLQVAGYPDQQPPRSTYDPAPIRVLLFAGGRRVSGIEIGTRDPRGINLFARGPDEPAVFLLSPAALLNVPYDLDRLKSNEVEAPLDADRG